MIDEDTINDEDRILVSLATHSLPSPGHSPLRKDLLQEILVGLRFSSVLLSSSRDRHHRLCQEVFSELINLSITLFVLFLYYGWYAPVILLCCVPIVVFSKQNKNENKVNLRYNLFFSRNDSFNSLIATQASSKGGYKHTIIRNHHRCPPWYPRPVSSYEYPQEQAWELHDEPTNQAQSKNKYSELINESEPLSGLLDVDQLLGTLSQDLVFVGVLLHVLVDVLRSPFSITSPPYSLVFSSKTQSRIRSPLELQGSLSSLEDIQKGSTVYQPCKFDYQ